MGVNKNAPEGSVRGAGNFTCLAGPKGSIEDYAAATATELNGAAMVDVTYSMPPDGFNYTPGFEELDDGRLTYPVRRIQKGQRTDTFMITIVYGAEDQVAADVFVEGAELEVVERRITPHNDDFTAGDKYKLHPVDVISVEEQAPSGDREVLDVTMSYRQERVRGVVAAAA